MARSEVMASMYFMQRNVLFTEEKPYEFCYTADVSIPQSNITREKHDDVPVHDIRGQGATFNLERNGFSILKLDEQLPYDDYFDPTKVTHYLRALETLLKDHLGASNVEVFRHGLRKRHAAFPVATGTGYAFDQPTSVAHVDTTTAETLAQVRRQQQPQQNACGSAPQKLDRSHRNRRVQWVNVWKPLRGPLHDWPLAVCDAATVDAAADLEPADLLYPDHVTENAQVYFNQGATWWYLSGQETDELVVFKQSDTLAGSCPGVPHCSFFNPHAPADEPPRESIEARALVYYD